MLAVRINYAEGLELPIEEFELLMTLRNIIARPRRGKSRECAT